MAVTVTSPPNRPQPPHPPGQRGVQRQLVLWSITSALAGFLFGFDTVVISGAEQTIQALWGLTPGVHGIVMASALYGTVVGSLVGAWPAERYGRRPTLFWIGVLYFVSAVWSAVAWDAPSLIVARFIGGLGIGLATVTAPMYIAEISPPAYRGRLTGLFQFNIVFGIIAAFASNALLAGIGDDAWRWMLAAEAPPALAYTLMCLIVPESPRWLLTRKRDRSAALRVLALIEPDAPGAQLEREADAIVAASASQPADARFWTMRQRVPILLAFLVAFFNQLSGINAILYFSPRIFELTGLGRQAALLQSIGIGVTNLIFTIVGLWLIDRLGRRTLLTIGSFGYIASLGLCAWAFFTQNFAIVPACIFAFIAAHAVGQGAVIWVLISEVFPNEHRAAGQSLGSATHWIFAALLTTAFPAMVTAFAPGWIFLFFCGMMALQLLWVRTMVPETKGVPLEELQLKLGVSR
jgi:MFS transporter, SP family, arabinose:H+ symporter